MGCIGADGWIREQSFLRLVRCANRLHFHHCQLHGPVGKVVEESGPGNYKYLTYCFQFGNSIVSFHFPFVSYRAGGAHQFHGEGQRAFPFGHFPLLSDWRG